MEQSLKPGQDAVKKIRSSARPARLPRWSKRAATIIVLLAVWLVPLACTSSYVAPERRPPTPTNPSSAVAGLNFPSGETPIPAETAAPTAQPTATTGPLSDPQEPQPTEEPRQQSTAQPPILYYTQAGDTLKALAARFNVEPHEITSPEPIPTEGLFDPGMLLLIPHRLGETSPSTQLIPDSEVVYSPSALDFDIEAVAAEAGGYLSKFREWRFNDWHSGAAIINRVGLENSINPRLLLVILEQQSNWVYGQPQTLAQTDYPIGWLLSENEKKGLYYQLSWAVQQLNIGYYGWREGTVTELTFPNGDTMRLAPDLNAGTVALLYLFSRLYNQPEWAGIMYGPEGLMATYERMVGNPWLRAQTVEPLFPATLTQPPLELPFLPGHTWALTGGPHSAWAQGHIHPRAALDFAPSAVDHGCVKTDEWATAVADGLVVRSGDGVVVLDLDGDGHEQTGWVVLYLHIAADGRAPLGSFLHLNDRIGHPSCEGGVSTGTHVHIARKYNGEWILADGPMPFTLSGWRAHAAEELYFGTLTKDDQTVYSSLVGSFESRITRPFGSGE